MTTRALANWVVDLQHSDIPVPVQRAAERSLYNYIGCAIGGSKHATVVKARDALADVFGKPTSTVFGNRGAFRTDAQHAALLNGIASHVHDFDDTHLATIIHPTAPVASAILAYVEQTSDIVSGIDLVTALIAGIEVSCKLGLSVWPFHYDLGWHITSTTGSIGAAMAVAKLMHLNEIQTVHAIGIAATQVTGLRELFGSDTKSFHVGRAAQNGLLAAQLARNGFTSSESAIEARRGWAHVVLGPSERASQLEKFCSETSGEGLGKTWEVERNAFKPFPCGIVCHPAIDGAIQLHKELAQHGVMVEEIEKVDLRVHPLVIELTSKRSPRDGLEGKFSVFHGAAVGFLFGKAGPTEYADAVVNDSDVTSLRDRIDAHSDGNLRVDEAFLTLKLKDGRTIERHVESAVGSLEKPMTDEDLERKFVGQCEVVLGEVAARVASGWVRGMMTMDDVTAVLREL